GLLLLASHLPDGRRRMRGLHCRAPDHGARVERHRGRVPRARQRRAVAEGHRPRPSLATRRARPMNPILEAIRALQSEPTRDYAPIRQRCEDVRKLLTSEAAAGRPTAETGGNARLSELLERIWSPGPSWFLDSPALADELLAACVESLTPK